MVYFHNSKCTFTYSIQFIRSVLFYLCGHKLQLAMYYVIKFMVIWQNEVVVIIDK